MTDRKSTIVRAGFDRVSPALVAKAEGLSTATIHEAGGKIGVMPSEIKPVHPHFRVCGPAMTVHSPPGDNLWLHYAIYEAQPGDVLVVHVEGKYDHGYWGEVMSTAAKARHLGGLVIDGCVRDFTLLEEVGFPVFSRGLCIRGTGKDKNAYGAINRTLRFDGLSVEPGDLIVGDNDGVVVVPQARSAEVIEASRHRDEDELDICRRLMAGETTIDIYKLG
ncbi:MAG: 4-carboxy-4-hydroxy-2-oxoadipate aldolase/oxaloacetate decarboxylase [Sphingobium sp.]|nr:4-carboxy-4-hydroxy-2-oxoadipate aldolase/oxaloacetate decarboxylase [Sphingobium sp.]MBP8671787.1 4-carboxy-4-hydroxy-2-oxoadipate aldolase/oxaloacetate decarboxylase [Sphingobium sp.]MBP9158047.1 4-carboxy-4-hydroxy-2-oxoadipate aldolase/oxaloacetate decarboxylase [Sphingobium sp.]MCC6480927.1 4-carboxy-4-hydroxy-2-oxoadipate aldolase/oxaloacetate decarboxylase [Sphingomonadaceae bacterium]